MNCCRPTYLRAIFAWPLELSPEKLTSTSSINNFCFMYIRSSGISKFVKSYGTSCGLFILWLALIQVLFLLILVGQDRILVEAVQSSIHQQEGSDPRVVSQTLSEYSRIGLISCVKLSRAGTTIIDLDFQSDCGRNRYLLQGEILSSDVKSLNGQTWQLHFSSNPPGAFHLAAWIARLSGLIIICLSTFTFNLMARTADARLKFEIEKGNEREKIARQVGHDLRSPLGALSIICKRFLDAGSEAQSIAQSALDRIAQIGTDLLENETVRHQESVEIDVALIIHELVSSFGQMNVNVNWQLRIECKLMRLPLAAANFYRLLSNLVQNGVDATKGVVDSRIAISAVLSGAELHIAIRDNGIGIPDAILARLQTETFTFGKENGHGLGLAYIRKTLAKVHGSLVLQANAVGTGTTAILKIPLSDA